MQPFPLRLLLAAIDGNGTIAWMDNRSETALATGDDQIAATMDTRMMDEHRAALQELVADGFIKQRTAHIYDVLPKGRKHIDDFRSPRNEYHLGDLALAVLCKAFHRDEGYRNIKRIGEPRAENPVHVRLMVGPENVTDDAAAIEKCFAEFKKAAMTTQADDGGDVWHLGDNGIKQATRLCGLAD